MLGKRFYRSGTSDRLFGRMERQHTPMSRRIDIVNSDGIWGKVVPLYWLRDRIEFDAVMSTWNEPTIQHDHTRYECLAETSWEGDETIVGET